MTRTEAIVDLITLFCGEPPPFEIKVERLRELPDNAHEKLQEFIVNRVRLQWLTGIGVMESIDVLIDEAIANSLKDFEECTAYATKPLICRPGDAVRVRRGKKITIGIVTSRGAKSMRGEKVTLRSGNGVQTDTDIADIIGVFRAREP